MIVAALVVFFALLFLGLPIAFIMGAVSGGMMLFDGFSLEVLVQRMFAGANSFSLLALPLFILAGNIMGEGGLTRRLMRLANVIVGRLPGGLAMTSVATCTLFGAVSGSTVATTFAVGSVVVPEMKRQKYSNAFIASIIGPSGVLGLIIPPSITMVVYAGIANVGTGALFMTGLVPGVLLGIAMMAVVAFFADRKHFPRGEKMPAKQVIKMVAEAFPALLTPIILIGGIVSGLFTPTESAAFACIYALIIGIFFYRTIKLSRLPGILIETMKLSSLSLFALATANALGELLSYYHLNVLVQQLFVNLAAGKLVFLLIVVAFFMFVGTFMDAVPAMILFVPIILPTATSLGISPIILGLVIVVTLALGLVTPPYGLCLLLAGTISGITIEESFKGVLPYFLSSLAVLALLVLFPEFWLAIPAALFPALF